MGPWNVSIHCRKLLRDLFIGISRAINQVFFNSWVFKFVYFKHNSVWFCVNIAYWGWVSDSKRFPFMLVFIMIWWPWKTSELKQLCWQECLELEEMKPRILIAKHHEHGLGELFCFPLCHKPGPLLIISWQDVSEGEIRYAWSIVSFQRLLQTYLSLGRIGSWSCTQLILAIPLTIILYSVWVLMN